MSYNVYYAQRFHQKVCEVKAAATTAARRVPTSKSEMVTDCNVL